MLVWLGPMTLCLSLLEIVYIGVEKGSFMQHQPARGEIICLSPKWQDHMNDKIINCTTIFISKI